ncbi:TPA: hypothetical protein ORP55_001544 [Escherichia coli]|nr:hypothetical protein [Escherichia coli]
MKIKANTIKEITSIKVKGADAMHSLDSYFQRTTAPKSAAQERREGFQEKVMRSADYIADKFVETVRPLVDEVADKLQSEMPEDMEGTAKARLLFELSRRFGVSISTFK